VTRRSPRLSRLTRPVRDVLTIPLLETLRRLATWLPHRTALALGRALGRLAWLVCVGPRRRARRHLELAGLVSDPAQAGWLVRRVFAQTGMNAVEFLHATAWSDRKLLSSIDIEGGETIRTALQGKRGLIFVTGHVSNWELMPRFVQLSFGIGLTIPMSSRRNERLNLWLKRRRDHDRVKIVDADKGSMAIMRALRRGEGFGVLADQDTTRGRGIFVSFFGRPAYTPLGPAHLARLCNATLVPLILERNSDDPCRHLLRVGRATRPNPDAHEEADLLRMTQEYTRFLEDCIRRRPELWVWFHQRWRRRPGQSIPVRSAGGRRQRPDGPAAGDP
jgi:KDO2-lipid IV(A) lauroyltransferase